MKHLQSCLPPDVIVRRFKRTKTTMIFVVPNYTVAEMKWLKQWNVAKFHQITCCCTIHPKRFTFHYSWISTKQLSDVERTLVYLFSSCHNLIYGILPQATLLLNVLICFQLALAISTAFLSSTVCHFVDRQPTGVTPNTFSMCFGRIERFILSLSLVWMCVLLFMLNARF